MSTKPLDIAQDGNLFPREDLLEAVAQSDWRDREVPRVTWALSALGLTLVAAGLPIARIVLTGPVEFAANSSSFLTSPAHALVAAIGRTGIGIEAVFFLASALALGATLPALGLAMRAAGFRGRLVFVSSLIAVASPLLLLHGRLPSDSPFAALAGAIVLAAVVTPRDPGPRGRRGYAVRIVAALALLTLVVGRSAVAASVDGGLSSLFGGWANLALAGGVCWVAVPLAWIRQPEELPPPTWLVGWIVVAAALAVTLGPLGGVLVLPALALLLANVLARRARPDGALRWALGLAAGQIALAAAAASLAPPNTTCFAATGRGETRPGDTVWVDDGTTTTAYLLRRRLGLRVQEHGADSFGMTSGSRHLALDGPKYAWQQNLDSQTGEVTSVE